MKERKASDRLIGNAAVTMIVIWCIVAVLLSGGIAWWHKVYSNKDRGLHDFEIEDKKDSFLAEWQEYLSNDANIINVAIPGSHASATNGMMLLAETQRHSVYEQLCAGVRYLDLRVTEKNGKLVMFHNVIKGRPFEDVLDEINLFLDNHPKQFLILDFHETGKTCEDKVISAVKDSLNMDRAVNKNEFPYFSASKDADAPALTMGKIRSAGYNYVLVWGGNPDKVKGEDNFYNKENNVLVSPYDIKYHRKRDAGELIKHLDSYYESYKGNGFFVLQAVRTSANVLMQRPMDNELAFKPAINKFISDLGVEEEMKDRLNLTNIVMRDYIASDPENVKDILALNYLKKEDLHLLREGETEAAEFKKDEYIENVKAINENRGD